MGIYRVSKGQLEICWADIGDTKRPKKFTGKLALGAGKRYDIFRSEDYKEPPAIAKELERFQGRWVSEEKDSDGLMVEDDGMVFLWGGNNKGSEAKFTVDPSKKVKEIEVIYTVGSWRYHRQIGIYQIDNKKLTLSLSDLDSDKRPKKLAGSDKLGGGKMFFVYVRKPEK